MLCPPPTVTGRASRFASICVVLFALNLPRLTNRLEQAVTVKRLLIYDNHLCRFFLFLFFCHRGEYRRAGVGGLRVWIRGKRFIGVCTQLLVLLTTHLLSSNTEKPQTPLSVYVLSYSSLL